MSLFGYDESALCKTNAKYINSSLIVVTISMSRILEISSSKCEENGRCLWIREGMALKK
jgi:hypothetical protein